MGGVGEGEDGSVVGEVADGCSRAVFVKLALDLVDFDLESFGLASWCLEGEQVVE